MRRRWQDFGWEGLSAQADEARGTALLRFVPRSAAIGVVAAGVALTSSSIAFAQSALPPLPPLPPDEAPSPAVAPPAPIAPPAPVAASPSDLPPPAPPPPPQRVWYGNETLLVDGASFAITVLGAGLSVSSGGGGVGTALGLTGTFGYLLGGPIVHWVHGHAAPGFGDLAIRLFAPGVMAIVGIIPGAIIGGQISSCNENGDVPALNCGFLWGFVAGAVVGYLGAIALDAAVLAWEPAPAAPPAGTATASAFTLAPVVRMARESDGSSRPLLGVGGTF